MLLLHRALLGVGGAASSFTPADFGTDLLLWLKADTGVTESGGAVSDWADQSTYATNATQGTAGNKPTYSATGFNSSYPGIAFATNDFLDVLSFTGTTGALLSAFVVGFLNSGSDSAARILSYGNKTLQDYNSTASSALIIRNGSTEEIASFRNSAYRSTKAITYATPQRFGSIYDGTNHTVYVNNVAGSASAFTSVFGGTFGGNGIMRVGAQIDNSTPPIGNGFLNGTVAEVVITKTALDSTARSNLDTYFKNKWGLS